MLTHTRASIPLQDSLTSSEHKLIKGEVGVGNRVDLIKEAFVVIDGAVAIIAATARGRAVLVEADVICSIQIF